MLARSRSRLHSFPAHTGQNVGAIVLPAAQLEEDQAMNRHAGASIPLAVARRLAALALLFTACGGDGLTGPAAESCGPGPYFSALPVPLAEINAIVVVGGLGAPGHTLPTAHAGIALRTVGTQVFAPGNMQITRLRRVRYLVSPNRQGVEDYATEFQVCRDVSGWFGHVTSLASTIPVPQNRWRDCEQYSTPTERVESCSRDRKSVV